MPDGIKPAAAIRTPDPRHDRSVPYPTAIAMYLACLYEQRGQSDEPVWIAPRMGRERYDLSDETRNKGLRELTDQGLLSLGRRPVPGAAFARSA